MSFFLPIQLIPRNYTLVYFHIFLLGLIFLFFIGRLGHSKYKLSFFINYIDNTVKFILLVTLRKSDDLREVKNYPNR